MAQTEAFPPRDPFFFQQKRIVEVVENEERRKRRARIGDRVSPLPKDSIGPSEPRRTGYQVTRHLTSAQA